MSTTDNKTMTVKSTMTYSCFDDIIVNIHRQINNGLMISDADTRVIIPKPVKYNTNYNCE